MNNFNYEDLGNKKVFKLNKNSKNPACSWKLKQNSILLKELYNKCNYGILTGYYCYDNRRLKRFEHNNNITILDIDFYKHNYENHKFISEFGNKEEFIKSFNTLTVQTGGGGLHLYFQYVDDDELPSKINQKLHIDLLNSNKYIVGPSSKITSGKYEIIHNVPIAKMPEKLIIWLGLNIYEEAEPQKINKIIKNNNKNERDENNSLNDIKYLINDREIYYNVIKKLDDSYFTDRIKWLHFTQFMKGLNKKNLWDKISSKYKNYNKTNNFKIWSELKLKDVEIGINHIFTIARKKVMIPYIKYKSFIDGSIEPDEYINKLKLGYDFFKDDKYKHKNIVVKSDTGTGKTTSFKHLVINNDIKFISLISRVSLGQEQYNNFSSAGINCCFYKYVDNINNGQNVICQLDSILRLYNIVKNISSYVLFIDEFNSLYEYLITSDTLKKNNKRYKIFKMFITILNNCRQFIAVDADISDSCLMFLEELNINYHFIKNKAIHYKNIKTQELKNFNKFISKLKLEKKFLCCCDSFKEANKIYNELKKYHDEYILLITSKTVKYHNLDKYDKVIYTPKIVYGLDSIMKRNVYAYYKEHTINPKEFLQQITRCRNIKKLYYTFLKKKFKKPIYNNIDECRDDILEKNKLCVKELGCLVGEELTNIYLKSLIRITYKNDCYNTNKLCYTLKFLKERGFIVKNHYTYISKSKIQKLKEKELLELIKKNEIDNFDFNDPVNIRINNYLQIPSEYLKIDNEFILNLFIDNYKLEKHWNLCDMLFKNHEVIKSYLFNAENFNIDIIKSNKYKIHYFNQLIKLSKCDHNYNATVGLTDETSLIMGRYYKKVFRCRSKTDINFTNVYEVKKHICKIIKLLLPDDVYKIKNKKKMINKKMIYYNQIELSNDILQQHKQIYDFRSKKQIKFIDSEDSDDDFLDDNELEI